MDKLLLPLGSVFGALGILLCAVAGFARLAGLYWLAGMQVGTLMQAGIAAMVAGCFCLLLMLARRAPPR